MEVHIGDRILHTHDAKPGVISAGGVTERPSESIGGVISKTCKTEATAMKKELELKCLPGQILETGHMRARH